MASSRRNPSTCPKTYFETVIKTSTEWLKDDRQSNLSTRINDKAFNYYGRQIGICN